MTPALLFTAFTLGLRHGVDWDHIAAIADLSSSAESRRRGFVLSFLYAVGHAVVVLILGGAAIVASASIPDGLDKWMGRIVGVTLLVLGVWVITELIRKGRDFRLRSRWMLMLHGTFAGLRRVRDAGRRRTIIVDHSHGHDHDDAAERGEHDESYAHDHAHVEADVEVDLRVAERVGVGADAPNSMRSSWRRHRHAHRHELTLPDAPEARYGGGTAAGIGMLHGVGIESPTQIAIFVTATAAVGASAGVVLLFAWVVGLVVANAALALLAGYGLLHAERNFRIYATLAVVIAIASIIMGLLLVTGTELLPDIAI